MLDPKDIERYRRMTIAERFDEMIQLMIIDEAQLASLPPAERDRRLRLIEEENELSRQALLRALTGH